MADRITAIKKVSLAQLSEGWGDECYAIVRPTIYPDMIALDQLDPADKKATSEYQSRLVQDHFVTGKIKIWTPSGQEVVDMAPEDVDCSVAVSDKLFAEIIGIDVDPKDLREELAQRMTQQDDDVSIGTSSNGSDSSKSMPTSPAN